YSVPARARSVAVFEPPVPTVARFEFPLAGASCVGDCARRMPPFPKPLEGEDDGPQQGPHDGSRQGAPPRSLLWAHAYFAGDRERGLGDAPTGELLASRGQTGREDASAGLFGVTPGAAFERGGKRRTALCVPGKRPRRRAQDRLRLARCTGGLAPVCGGAAGKPTARGADSVGVGSGGGAAGREQAHLADEPPA